MIWETMQAPFAVVCVTIISAFGVNLLVRQILKDKVQEQYGIGFKEGQRVLKLNKPRDDDG